MPQAANSTDFPVPLARFLARIKGTDDEIWSRLLKDTYGTQNHTLADWGGLLSILKARRV